MIQRIGRVAAAVALTVPLYLLGTSSAAHATPYSCAWGPYGPRGSYATCNYGSGAYRSWTQCRRAWGSWYIRYGPWQTPSSGALSSSSCSWGETRYSYGINLS